MAGGEQLGEGEHVLICGQTRCEVAMDPQDLLWRNDAKVLDGGRGWGRLGEFVEADGERAEAVAFASDRGGQGVGQ